MYIKLLYIFIIENSSRKVATGLKQPRGECPRERHCGGDPPMNRHRREHRLIWSIVNVELISDNQWLEDNNVRGRHAPATDTAASQLLGLPSVCGRVLYCLPDMLRCRGCLDIASNTSLLSTRSWRSRFVSLTFRLDVAAADDWSQQKLRVGSSRIQIPIEPLVGTFISRGHEYT